MIYFDHAATSPILSEVKKAMFDASERLYGNAASIHAPGHSAYEVIEKARATVAKLINADSSEIIFTSGATEGNNTALDVFARQNIYVSEFEHSSVSNFTEKWQPTTIKLSKLFADNKDFYSSLQFKQFKTSGANYSLISCQLANHEIGTIFPVKQITKLAHKNHFFVHTDATQAIGKIPVNVRDLDVDYLTFSAHKFGGPTGIGVLFVKNGVPFQPLLKGGHQESGRRAGTHNTVGIVGLAAAAQYIIDKNTPVIYETKIRPLCKRLRQEILNNIPGSSVNELANFSNLPNILNVTFRGAEGESIQLYLDHKGIVVSTGSACASSDGSPSPVLMALHNDAEIAHSSIRFSLGLETRVKDINEITKILPNIIKNLQEISTV